MWHFVDLRFAGSITLCGPKTSANPLLHNFSPYKYMLKMLSFLEIAAVLMQSYMAFLGLNILS
jgi:hypothetical protein